MHRKALFAALVIALFGWVGFKVFYGGSAPQRDRGAATVMVQTAQREMLADKIEALGTAKANESVVITSQVTEMIKSINFDDGMNVDEGRILVELSQFEESADLQDARANLIEQEKQHKRALELVKSGAATKSRLDTQTAALNSARARVAAMEARINDRVIKAPFSGVLGLRQVSPGTLVQPGTVITTLDDVRVMKLDFAIPETYLAEIENNLTIHAKNTAYPDKVFEGQVTGVDTRVDPITRTIAVRAELPNPDGIIRPGMLMVVEVTRHPREGILVPEQAVASIQDKQYVYVLDAANKAERVTVTTGVRRQGKIEITSGINEGDQVVIEGGFKLRPGLEAIPVPYVQGGAAL